MRLRIWVAREWERARHREAMFAGPDMGAHTSSLPEAFPAEAGNLACAVHAHALLDLVKAFETVPHWVLVEAAKLQRHPIATLRLSLAACRLRRTIGVDGVYFKTIVATRGITADSVFARTSNLLDQDHRD